MLLICTLILHVFAPENKGGSGFCGDSPGEADARALIGADSLDGPGAGHTRCPPWGGGFLYGFGGKIIAPTVDISRRRW